MTEPTPVSPHTIDILNRAQKKFEAEMKATIEKYGPDYDKAIYSYPIAKCEAAAISEWLEELQPEIDAKLKGGSYGVTGGNLSYTFTPTSLGTILTVKEAVTGKELNVSDAVNWVLYG